jgi:putative salt-induced outer membrane protein
VIVDSTRTTLNLVTGLDAKVSDRLRSRVSYAVDYDSKPPAGKVSTDTVTRLTLVYDF